MQFLHEYSTKVDDLIKDKLEATEEKKSKENEEKDLVAQSINSCVDFHTLLLMDIETQHDQVIYVLEFNIYF